MKERMITRTINTNNVEVIALEKESKTVVTRSHTMFGNFTETEMERYYKALYKDSPFKYLAIGSVEIIPNLYGMSETDFINLGRLIEK